MFHNRHITVIVPAYNEELAIEEVLLGLKNLTNESGNVPLVDQIVVCDNGSTDRTAKIASACDSSVVYEPIAGYGAACQAGLASLSYSDIVVFVDADRSVVVPQLPGLLTPIVAGADLVIGSRVLGRCEKGALTFPQRVGNALAAFLIRHLWRVQVTDLGPFRAVTSDALEKIDMQDRRFGWTVEMQIRAIQEGLRMVEVPVSALRRIGKSKISGTVNGVVTAGIDIIGTVVRLFLIEHHVYAGNRFASR